MSDMPRLGEKKANLRQIARQALKDEQALAELLKGISPETKKMALRENSSKVLMLLSEETPRTLLPHWEYFVDLLRSDNAFSKYVAIHIISAMVASDDAGRFERAFEVYFGLLDDESLMVACHAAGCSGRIGRAKPRLCSKITGRLLGIDKTHFEAGRKGLIKGYALDALGEYFDGRRDRSKIIAFVTDELESTSAKTRKKAREFLRQWGEPVDDRGRGAMRVQAEERGDPRSALGQERPSPTHRPGRSSRLRG